MKHIIITTIISICCVAASMATRIAILSDVHVVPGNECELKLKSAVDEINGDSGLDLVVMNGDLTNEGSDEQLVNVKSILDLINKPLFTIPGNHENNWSQSATRTFVELWGNDRFITSTDSLIIVGINCGPFMKMGDGHIKQEDLHWLEATLSKATAGNDKKVVSFCHYPLADDLDNYLDYASVLHHFPTIVHVNGHYHKNEPYFCGDINCMMVRSLDRKKGNFGYTLMDVTPDSVVFYEKRLNEAPVKIYACGHSAPSPSTIKPAELPISHHLTKVWADSASIFTRLGFDTRNVYFGNSLGQVKAIDKTTNQPSWIKSTGAPVFSRPVAIDGRLAVPCSDKKLLVLSTDDGEQLGCYKAEGPYVADGLRVGDNLVQGGYKRIECWGLIDGKCLWVNDSIDNYCQASPANDGNDIVFGAWDTYLRCLDLATGAERWRWSNGKKANMLSPGNVVPVIASDKVIIVAPDRFMTAIDRQTGETLWRDNSYKYRESLGSNTEATVAYAKTMDGELVAVDITQPQYKTVWVTDLGLGYEHAPCVVAQVGETVYTGSRRGVVTAVDAKSGNVLWSEKVGSSEVNGIDIDPTDNSVWVSLIEGSVFRVM